ncbi:MAG TPA: hypothetical protein PKB14_14780 [Rubrivivax sp.]|nr:hypothetical protein [Rubrivivax sp.]
MALNDTLRSSPAALAALLALALGPAGWAAAQSEGGLYIAGAEFSFKTAAERGLAQNPRGQRFFVLALPPESAALTTSATRAQVRLRERVLAANGVLMVCRRDLDNGRIAAQRLAPGVVAVRGWPAQGVHEMSPGQRHFAGEDPAPLPASNEALRRLRSACS